MTIALIDTCVFCEILRVPNMDTEHQRYTRELRAKVEAREKMMLPMAAILETGNHIGQNGDGRQRREAGQRFIDQVLKAMDGTSPFTPTKVFDEEDLRRWLEVFPDWTERGSGLGDLTIEKEWERQCELNPGHRVYIWSKDRHLQSYDRS